VGVSGPSNYEIATGTIAPPVVAADSGGGWVALKDYLIAVRAGDEALAAERDQRYREVGAERDQRYAEVKAAEEKALKVKETADLKALDLASQIQTYKDEKANELREQISSERGLYATRDDLASALREINATIRPIAEYVSGQQGRSGGERDSRTERRLDIGQVVAVVAVIVAILSVVLYALKK
jgi:hypothetical protein